MATDQQTVIVKKTPGMTLEKATEQAKKYAKRIYTHRETADSFRFRQRPPSDFVDKSYKTVSMNENVSIVYGTLK